jgi:hypothetical protein
MHFVQLISHCDSKTSDWTTIHFVPLYRGCERHSKINNPSDDWVGRDSSVGFANGYGMDRPGIESRWGRDFPHPSKPVLWPTQRPIQWVPDPFPGGKAFGAWCWPNTPSYVEVKERVELYVYSPSGPSRLVLGWTLDDSSLVGLDFMPFVTVSPTFRRLWPSSPLGPVKSKENVGSNLLRNFGFVSWHVAAP